MEAEIREFLGLLRTKIAATTYQSCEWMLRDYLRYLRKTKTRAMKATPEHIRDYLLSLRRCNPVTRRRRWTLIRDFYAFTRREDNPACVLRVRARRTRPLYRIPSMSSVAAMLKKIGGRTELLQLRNRLLVELAYGSGLRLCELQRLSIEDIDQFGGTAQVRGKGGRMRTIPLTSATQKLLREYLDLRSVCRGPLFVCTQGRRLGAQAIAVTFRKMTGCSPHAFRHACATHMLHNGCDTRYIQELLGHRYLTTTQVYTHISKRMLREVIDRRHPRAKAG